jgi:hydrogenase maturation protease
MRIGLSRTRKEGRNITMSTTGGDHTTTQAYDERGQSAEVNTDQGLGPADLPVCLGDRTPVPEQMQGSARILVAGIGDICLGDDGFGCEVVRRLAGSELPQGVVVVNYGIRGLHLAYDLLQHWSQLILVDALPDSGAPGRVLTFEIDPEHLGVAEVDPHDVGPQTMLSSLRALGGQIPPTVLIGAQVRNVDDHVGLSAEMEAAVPIAIDAIQSLLERLMVSASLGASAEVT